MDSYIFISLHKLGGNISIFLNLSILWSIRLFKWQHIELRHHHIVQFRIKWEERKPFFADVIKKKARLKSRVCHVFPSYFTSHFNSMELFPIAWEVQLPLRSRLCMNLSVGEFTLGATRRLLIPSSCSLEVWQLVWTDDWWLLMQNQTNQPSRKCQAAAGEVPPTFHVLKLSFPSFPWTAEPSSSAQGIMGKVCQFSRIWHWWVILSQGLFFKGPPKTLVWGLMLTLTLTVWPIFGVNCKQEWENLFWTDKLSFSLEF